MWSSSCRTTSRVDRRSSREDRSVRFRDTRSASLATFVRVVTYVFETVQTARSGILRRCSFQELERAQRIESTREVAQRDLTASWVSSFARYPTRNFLFLPAGRPATLFVERRHFLLTRASYRPRYRSRVARSNGKY